MASYTIVKGYLEDGRTNRSENLNRFIEDVNANIKNGYTPLGSPGIDRSGNTLNVYQAFIKTPAAAAGGSKSTSRKSYKKYTKKSSSRRHKNRK